jgi:hypothetical protein
MTRRSRQSRRSRRRPSFGYDTTEAEAAEFLGISSRRLAQLRRNGCGPHHVRWRGRIWYALNDMIGFHKDYAGSLSSLPGKSSKTDKDG